MVHDCVLALGFFDGIHLGHAALLDRTRQRAQALGLTPAALSFDTHPDTLVFGTAVPLLNTMAERELLMRRLPDEVVAAHQAQDDFSVEQLAAMLPGVEGKKLELFSAALRAVFLLLLHKREIGAPIFDDVLKMLLHGVAIQLFEVKND